jgi:YegS/Rv2252/BmrU family lipid kinase
MNQTKLAKAVIIFNPKSGKQDPMSEQLIKNIAKNIGWQGTFIKTTTNNNASMITAQAIRKGIDHIVVCGGDGTVREVLGQIRKHSVTVGIVPLGTGNILAKNLSLPLNINHAVYIAFNGKIKKIDIGEANGNIFVLIAAMGLDLDAISANSEIKSKLGTTAYVLEALKNISKKAEKYELVIDSKSEITVRAKSIMVANIGTTEAGIKIVPGADPQSGDLKIGIVKANTLSSWITLIFNALKGEIHKSPNFNLLQGQKIEITPVSGPKPYECDGDVFPPVSKLNIKIYPHAVSVLTP